MITNPFTPYGSVNNSGLTQGLQKTLGRWGSAQGGFQGLDDPSQGVSNFFQGARFWGAMPGNPASNPSSTINSGAFQNQGFNGGRISATYTPDAINQYRKAWQSFAPSMISRSYNRFMTR